MKYTKELHLQHVAAWWDGKLEFNSTDKWVKALVAPSIDSTPKYYRIRPEPRLRPWKPEEVPVGALIRSKTHSWRSLILGVRSNGYMEINAGGFEPKFALENHEHSTDGGRTWSPCGVEEAQ